MRSTGWSNDAIKALFSIVSLLLMAQQGLSNRFVCCLSVVPTKIARSRHIGISVTHKHNESVEIVEKPASSCFKSFGKAHERRKCDVLLATPINRTPMSWSDYCACSNLYYQPHPHVLCAVMQSTAHACS